MWCYGFLCFLVDDPLMIPPVSPRLAKNIGNLAPSLSVFEARVEGNISPAMIASPGDNPPARLSLLLTHLVYPFRCLILPPSLPHLPILGL